MKKRIVLSMVYIFLFGCVVMVIAVNDPMFGSRIGTYGRTDQIPTKAIMTPTLSPTMIPTITVAPTEPITPTPVVVPTIPPVIPTVMPTKSLVKPTSTPKLPQPTQPVAVPITNEGLYQLINQQRENNSLPVLTESTSSCNIAQQCVIHTLASISHCGYGAGTGVGVGENIATGYTSNEAVISAWMSSASHRANILSPLWQHSCVRVIDSNVVAIFTT